MTSIRFAQHSLNVKKNLLPTEKDVLQYEKQGWYKSKQIIPHSLLDEVKKAIFMHQLGWRDRELPRAAKFSDWRAGDGSGVRNNEFCSLQNSIIRKLVMLPTVGAIAAKLSRSSEIRLFDDQAVYKPPCLKGMSAAVVGWHTDHSYWSTCTSDRMLTAWIPFEDTSVENGTLCVVDGSHHWPNLEHQRGFNNPDIKGIERRLGRKIPQSDLSFMHLKKGQVSFHHMRALHASASNRTNQPRLALAVHMQDNRNSYQRYTTPEGGSVVLPHDQLCRRDAHGNPDYSDPEVFPQIWPDPEANIVDD